MILLGYRKQRMVKHWFLAYTEIIILCVFTCHGESSQALRLLVWGLSLELVANRNSMKTHKESVTAINETWVDAGRSNNATAAWRIYPGMKAWWWRGRTVRLVATLESSSVGCGGTQRWVVNVVSCVVGCCVVLICCCKLFQVVRDRAVHCLW